jgi:monoterpene epsilon-lactone hydrolase
MPSLRARSLNMCVALLIRRSRWGRDERAVARRARRLFGSTPVYQWLRTRGLRLTKVESRSIRGEWLEGYETEPGVILYFHGGGYVSCSAATHRPITAALARLSRRRVFSLDYRLAPEHRYPAALCDGVRAYRWLLEEEGVPAKHISLAGDSAGGGLVLGTLLRLRDKGLKLPACAVCFSPWTDLAGRGESMHFNDGRCAMFRSSNITEFADAYLGRTSPLDSYASPAFADLKGLPPVLLQVGSTELLLDDSRRIHDKIQEAKGESRLEIYEDLFHCWQMMDGFLPEARTALTRAAEFISEHASSEGQYRLR